VLLFQQGDFFGCAMVISLLQSVFVNAGLLVCYDVVLEVFFFPLQRVVSNSSSLQVNLVAVHALNGRHPKLWCVCAFWWL